MSTGGGIAMGQNEQNKKKAFEQSIMSAPMTAPVNAANVAAASADIKGIAGNVNFLAKNAPTAGTISSPQAKATAKTNTLPSIGDLQPGTGVIETNGKRVDVGNQIRQSGESVGGGQLVGITQGNNRYDPLAAFAADKSQSLLTAPAASYMAEDGTSVGEGANAVGAGIVSRGLANRAKSFADMSNANDAAASAVQNSNTNASEAASQAAAREAATALAQQNQTNDNAKTKSIVAGNNLDNAQKQQIANLQSQYLDPNVDEKTKAGIASQLSFLSGKTAQTNNFEPVMSKDELGNPVYAGAFNKQTGQLTPQIAQGAPRSTSMGSVAAPAGYMQVGTANGKPVYQDKNGNRFQ